MELSFHGHCPTLFFLMVVRLVTLGDLLGPLFGEGLAVAVISHGSGWSRGLTTLQRAAKAYKRIPDTTKAISVRTAPLSVTVGSSGRCILGRRKRRRSFFLPACSTSQRIVNRPCIGFSNCFARAYKAEDIFSNVLLCSSMRLCSEL